jgi:hypothetical protein
VRLRLSYDVACILGPALSRIFPEYCERIDAKIGRFHLFGHGFKCHIRHNILRSQGWALQVGEENEYDWARISHLVAAGRVMSSIRRTQIIDDFQLNMARRLKQKMGRILSQKAKRAREVHDEAKRVLDCLVGTTLPRRDGISEGRLVSEQYLLEQAAKQEEYYRLANVPDYDIREQLFECLNDEYRLQRNMEAEQSHRRVTAVDPSTPGPTLPTTPKRIRTLTPTLSTPSTPRRRSAVTSGTTPLSAIPSTPKGTLASISTPQLTRAKSKTNSLLAKVGETRQEWARNGNLFQLYHERKQTHAIRKLQNKIVETLTARNAEIEAIHRYR